MYTVVLMAALTTSVDLPDRRGGGGCCGCTGGGGHSRKGGGGCSGGCYGGGYGGCYGGGYGGCYGGGGGGCYGGGYGGCYGGGYSMGSGGCYGGGMIMPGTTIQQGTGGTGGEKLKTKPKERDESFAPAPATIVVELPADAKLLIDNEATTATGSSRVFQSPALNPGQEYHYTLTAQVVRDGKPVKAEQVVTIKPGAITPVKLTLPAAGVAQR